VHATFREAAKSRLLLEDDSEWDRCMSDASFVKMPANLRNLFCSICVWSNPADPLALFEKYKNFLIEDYNLQFGETGIATNKCLIDFQKYFRVHGKKCSSYNLPEPTEFDIDNYMEIIDLNKEKIIADELYSKLNQNQLFVVNKIYDSIKNFKQNAKNAFFIDGPGNLLSK
jgi:hypothetical protein